MSLNKSLYQSNNQCWETPHNLFAQLNKEFCFTLDAAADDTNHKCVIYYTKEDDSLKKNWIGVVWLNPPYGRELKDWISKARSESIKGATVVCLVPVRSDTRWWHNDVMKSSEIRLLTRRLTFHGGTNKAPFPACIVVFRPNISEPKLSSYLI